MVAGSGYIHVLSLNIPIKARQQQQNIYKYTSVE